MCVSALMLIAICGSCSAESYRITYYHAISFDHWYRVPEVKVDSTTVSFKESATGAEVRIVPAALSASYVQAAPGIYRVQFYKPAGSYIEWKDVKDLKIEPNVLRFSDPRTGKKVILTGTITIEEN
jgi:hypothetical protein